MDFISVETVLEKLAGLKIRSSDRVKFESVIRRHMSHSGFSDLGTYGTHLAHLAHQTSTGNGALDHLIHDLTVGESYVYRDHGQMAVIQNHVLPQIITHQKTSKKIRIWSAGCSTGEEPYSLSMLLHNHFPELLDYDVKVLGTDINTKSLDQARKGHYRAWSFRLTPEHLKTRYFQPQGQEWCVTEDLRKWVQFEHMNLTKDTVPTLFKTDGCDLIVCRNVFIYFHRSSIAGVLNKFKQVLRPGGYLMTGHAELYDQKLDGFEIIMLNDSAVYRRTEERAVPLNRPQIKKRDSVVGEVSFKRQQPTKPRAETVRPIPSTPQVQDEWVPIAQMIREGQLAQAQQICEHQLKKVPNHPEWLWLYARVQADLGHHTQAHDLAQKAIQNRKFWAPPIFLLAQLAEDMGNHDQAQIYLAQCFYVEPNFIPSYIHLAQILETEGDGARSQKLLAQAVQLLQKRPQSEHIDPFSPTTVSDWLTVIQSKISSF